MTSKQEEMRNNPLLVYLKIQIHIQQERLLSTVENLDQFQSVFSLQSIRVCDECKAMEDSTSPQRTMLFSVANIRGRRTYWLFFVYFKSDVDCIGKDAKLKQYQPERICI